MFSYENIHPHVNIFNKTMNIFSKFIPNKLVTFDDKDPPWMTEKLKEKIKSKQNLWGLLKNGKTEARYMYVAITEDYQLISESKGEYYNKLAMNVVI